MAKKKRGKKKTKSKGKKKKIRIFVSHASKDRPIAKRLVEAIREAIDVKKTEIRCTSVVGYTLTGGTHTSKTLRKEISGAEVLIGLVTPNSLKSTYVLFELGAAWGLRVPTLPLIAGGFSVSDVPDPLRERHVLNLATRTGANQAMEDLCELTTLKKKRDGNMAVIAAAVDELVSAARHRD